MVSGASLSGSRRTWAELDRRASAVSGRERLKAVEKASATASAATTPRRGRLAASNFRVFPGRHASRLDELRTELKAPNSVKHRYEKIYEKLYPFEPKVWLSAWFCCCNSNQADTGGIVPVVWRLSKPLIIARRLCVNVPMG